MPPTSERQLLRDLVALIERRRIVVLRDLRVRGGELACELRRLRDVVGDALVGLLLRLRDRAGLVVHARDDVVAATARLPRAVTESVGDAFACEMLENNAASWVSIVAPAVIVFSRSDSALADDVDIDSEPFAVRAWPLKSSLA